MNDKDLYESNLKRAATLPPDTMIRVPGKKATWRMLKSVLDACRGLTVRTQAGTLSPEACVAAIREFVTRPRAEVKAMLSTRCPVCLSEDIFGGSEDAGWQWRCRRCGAGFDDGDVGLDVDGLWYLWHRSDLDERTRTIVVGPFWNRGYGFMPAGHPKEVVTYEDVNAEYFALPEDEQRAVLVNHFRRRYRGN